MPRTTLVFGLVAWMAGCATSNGGTGVASPAHVNEPSAAEIAKPDTASSQAQDTRAASAANHDAAESRAAQEPPLAAALPTICASDQDCVPPREFAVAACRGRYPSMAIAMFEKHTPWQRVYLKAETLEAVNAYGERSTSTPLVYGEEVLVLRGLSQPKAGRLQISSSDIDVLRWDGTCATVAHELFSATRMPEVSQAKIRWRHLEDSFQEALLGSKTVAVAHEKHRAACKSSRSTAMEPACEKATDRLSEAISISVRGGLALPIPAKLPTWATPKHVNSLGAVAMIGVKRERR